MTGRVLVVGSLNADLVVRTARLPAAGETVTGTDLVTEAGGKSSNQAAAAALLGASVVLVGAVGSDAHGRFLLERTRWAGVATAVESLDGVATGVAVITVDRAGENTIVLSPGANAQLTPAHLPAVVFEGAAVLCLALEVPMETVLAAARRGHESGAAVVLNLSPYAAVPDELLRLTDVLLVNEHEAARFLGWGRVDGDWEAVRRSLSGRGIDRAVVTLGGDGAVVFDAGAVTTVPAVPVEVVDSTGCGDAFTGALAHRLAAGDRLVDAARFAALVGAIAATRAGAQASYPTAVEISEG
ncbi:ribokinase [Speluncibacter jeojiensis]|uniref:Ribokinase n=1 Tax=Speluncibacter jeojiensis TaxID=2710754 RepID=A0A9X4REV4_9ACTN|nr:ribokinase [Corynebacteriales bacterium D3-21]